MGGTSADEFPLLSALGLYAADIRGDAWRRHKEESEEEECWLLLVACHCATPSEADIDRVFESHLQSMAKGGTYGDNMEISAFSSAFDVDVKIYQRDFAYMVSGGGPDKQRDVAHIAYHTWEHYSSIRNLDGPHTGPPNVQVKALSPQEEEKQKEKLAQTPHVMPWMVDVVSASLPFLADKPTIKRTLEECKGNIDAAVSKLLDAEERGSISSAQESSSVEREPDSDDEAYNGPNKKQDRRMSRVTRQKNKTQDHRESLSKLATHDEPQEPSASNDSDASGVPNNQPASGTGEETSTPDPPRPPIKIKLRAPRPPTDDAPRPGGKTQQKQIGPQRQTARDRKDMKKQAQKAARKERQQAASKTGTDNAATKTGMALRSKGLTETPPIETGFRTLFI
ncbi:hypothetical protein H2203_003047 [Taxawa tesnikishii (nom. ined.)]|nr:hypothetical protein H2203_003047 [Dothideales sp. JES 119]